MKPVFIYALNCPVTGRTRYIGKSVNPNRRFRAHLKAPENCRRTNWIRNLQTKGQIPELELLAQVPETEADQWEIDYISAFKSLGFDLVNGTPGGDGVRGRFGEKHPLFGKHHSLEARAKISAGLRGKKQSLETREKRRVVQISKGPNTGAFKPGFTPWNKGKTLPHISALQRGRKRSSESKERQSASTKGVPWSALRRARYQERQNGKRQSN